jgi:hypothetical protein
MVVLCGRAFVTLESIVTVEILMRSAQHLRDLIGNMHARVGVEVRVDKCGCHEVNQLAVLSPEFLGWLLCSWGGLSVIPGAVKDQASLGGSDQSSGAVDHFDVDRDGIDAAVHQEFGVFRIHGRGLPADRGLEA